MKQTKVIFPGEKLSFLKTANPTNPFSNYINFYYEIYFSSKEEVEWYTSLPSLNTLICINLDGEGWSYIDDINEEQEVKSSTFVGHTLETRKFRHTRDMHNFFINLKPGLAGLLLPPHQRELEDTLIDLNYLFMDLNIEEQLCEAHNFRERINIFEKLFLPRLNNLKTNYKYHTVQNGLELLSQQQSLDSIDLEDISKELAVSYPTLYRYFKEITGYSPKFCQKLEKFKKGLRQYKLHGYNFNHWEYGFTDFSHFVKVSRQLTKRPPSELML